MYKRTVDLHVHTDNSPDGNHSAMFICEKAELTGLRALAFCDHCEIDSFYQTSMINVYARRITRWQWHSRHSAGRCLCLRA